MGVFPDSLLRRLFEPMTVLAMISVHFTTLSKMHMMRETPDTYDVICDATCALRTRAEPYPFSIQRPIGFSRQVWDMLNSRVLSQV
jgi:hypothetical protein